MRINGSRFLFLLLAAALGWTQPAALGQGGPPPGSPALEATPMRPADFSAPVLKWANKGCYSSWCETGWYASPAVADLDGDGAAEVIGASYSIFVVDGATGQEEWRVASGHDRSEPEAGYVGRTWPGVVVADLDGNGGLEIVTAHSGGYVSAYTEQGYFLPGWPQRPTPDNELRSLAVHDLDADGDLEVLVASTRDSDQWYVYEHDGSLRAGAWPELSASSPGYASGGFNENLAAGDLDGDGRAEIVGPNDTHYLTAFEDDGRQVQAGSIFGTNDDGSPKVWSQVGVHVDQAVDERGYANCGSEHRPNFANSAPAIADVNRDGVQEVVVIGNVYNCGTAPYTDLYEIPYILNGDRTRWHAGSYDWTVLPAPDANAAPLSEDYNRIEMSVPNPVPADLDGDGQMEILYPSYDGRMHAFWLDKHEYGSWPYAVTLPGEGFLRFASEPAVADLDGDGKAEVIFASWAEKSSGQTGKLHILDYLGRPIYEISLPPSFGATTWNGSMAAPTLDNIDGDADLEIVINTAHSGLVAYDLPGTAGARVLWGTGRGSYQRSGSYLTGSLAHPDMTVDRPLASPGDTLVFTFRLSSTGAQLSGVSLTNALPEGLLFAGGLTASSGEASEAGGVISWSGEVRPGAPVTVRYQAQVDAGISGIVRIANTAMVEDGQGNTIPLRATVVVNGIPLFLPLVRQ